MGKQKNKQIKGFSKLNKAEKISWLLKNFFTSDPIGVAKEFAGFWHTNVESQKMFDEISENTLTNFYMPYGVAPNFVINGKEYVVPMVIEESSVVAAASAAAKYWQNKGGFKAQVLSTTKVGHVHFNWKGEPVKLLSTFNKLKPQLLADVKHLTQNMEKRGGGVNNLELVGFNDIKEGYYQLKVDFETCDAMGANFINSVLEEFAVKLTEHISLNENFDETEQIEVIMAILSNYTPECVVRAWVDCKIEDLGMFGEMNAKEFAYKFEQAIHIAKNDPYRATTHNKGIYNGIDSVIIATGNDFRAIEACGHAYASRSGKYSSLSDCEIINGRFKFSIEIPLAVGTVGGLTTLHPLAKRSLELLGNPSAKELMEVVACTGLAQNFSAIKALVTSGIQKGHMKMHLNNILNHFNTTLSEREQVAIHFKENTVSFTAIRNFLEKIRGNDQVANS